MLSFREAAVSLADICPVLAQQGVFRKPLKTSFDALQVSVSLGFAPSTLGIAANIFKVVKGALTFSFSSSTGAFATSLPRYLATLALDELCAWTQAIDHLTQQFVRVLSQPTMRVQAARGSCGPATLNLLRTIWGTNMLVLAIQWESSVVCRAYHRVGLRLFVHPRDQSEPYRRCSILVLEFRGLARSRSLIVVHQTLDQSRQF